MNEKQIKRHLQDSGLRIADLARELSAEFGITYRSADTMLREMIAGRQWYPNYVRWLRDRYGIEPNRPQWLRNVRERLAA